MSDRINLRCDGCGNAMRVVREPHDPPNAVEHVTTYCNVCDEGGGFEETWYTDRQGNLVLPATA